MSKKFTFSTGYELDLGTDKLRITCYEKFTFNISEIKSVFVKMPNALFSGYISILDEYVFVKKKDMPQLLELLDYLKRLGVVVAYRKKTCTDTYIENKVSVGGNCSFVELINDDLIFYSFDDTVYKIDLSQIKCLWVFKGYMSFAKGDDFKDCVMVNNTSLSITYKDKYFNQAIEFAKNLEALGVNIKIIK